MEIKSKYRAKTYMENDSSVVVDGIFGMYRLMSSEDVETIESLLKRKYRKGFSWVRTLRHFCFPCVRLWLQMTRRRNEFPDRLDFVINGKYSMEKGEVISCKRYPFRAVYKVRRDNFVYEIEDSIWSYHYNKKTGIKKGVPVYVIMLGDDFGYELVKRNDQND